MTLSRIRDYITVGSQAQNWQQKSGACAGRININQASFSTLKGLPGIDDVLAQRIIRSRPFGSKDEITL